MDHMEMHLNGAHATHVNGKPVTFSITQLAEEFGLTTRAIRFYEDKGLLSPERQGQTRIYHPRDRARLILIVRGKNVGLALSEIKEILGLYDLHDGCETQNRVAIDKFRRRIASLDRQRHEIELQIATLEESCQRLEGQLEGQLARGDRAAQRDQTRELTKPLPEQKKRMKAVSAGSARTNGARAATA
ncbi:MerR family DNA-binding transcriptional regulator [Parvibaculum sp.]|uniref:MerR family transcriptional regulator n=1 Tax=Parvibaculum sp. TaxID=2024848 RepID=UPI0025F73B03|nr:MerR family DNA-binding transcriptional regulator [Parvibaculum sp.]